MPPSQIILPAVARTTITATYPSQRQRPTTRATRLAPSAVRTADRNRPNSMARGRVWAAPATASTMSRDTETSENSTSRITARSQRQHDAQHHRAADAPEDHPPLLDRVRQAGGRQADRDRIVAGQGQVDQHHLAEGQGIARLVAVDARSGMQPVEHA